jgi:hypothetical protein
MKQYKQSIPVHIMDTEFPLGIDKRSIKVLHKERKKKVPISKSIKKENIISQKFE